MVASVLYNLKFTNSLTIIGFEINPYNQCVTKKAFDESQMKIWFHIYDCKASQRKLKSNDCMIEWIHQEYEIIFEDGSGNMSVIWGKVHDSLGMTLYYTVCGQVSITMFSYME